MTILVLLLGLLEKISKYRQCTKKTHQACHNGQTNVCIKSYVYTCTQTQTCSFSNLHTRISHKNTVAVIQKPRVTRKRALLLEAEDWGSFPSISSNQCAVICVWCVFFNTLLFQFLCSSFLYVPERNYLEASQIKNKLL